MCRVKIKFHSPNLTFIYCDWRVSELMSRYVYQSVCYVSSSSDEESIVLSKSSKPKRKRPNRFDQWKKRSPLRYLTTSEEEDTATVEPDKNSIVLSASKTVPVTIPSSDNNDEKSIVLSASKTVSVTISSSNKNDKKSVGPDTLSNQPLNEASNQLVHNRHSRKRKLF